MQPMTDPAALLDVQRHDDVLQLTLNRAAKRNALSDALMQALQQQFSALPHGVRCVVLNGAGEHFCAGLDLAELGERDVFGGIQHSRLWHAALDAIQFAAVPVLAVLHGAVVGGGLEVASAAHVRVAETNTFYALPEAQRGLFVGGGGSVRLPRLIGVARMADMMLTGRVLDAEEGQQVGLSTYLVAPGAGLAKGLALAKRIAANAPLSNYAVVQALPRIASMAPAEGGFVESLMAAIAQGDPAAKARMQDFLAKRGGKVGEA